MSIFIKNLSLSFPHKTCFSDFSAQVSSGSRIAIIGRNGSGKSSLLNMLATPLDNVKIAPGLKLAYVPQILEADDQSGSQRLNQALTLALSTDPDILLLDEPTNHLDRANRHSLLRKLKSFSGILIVASHDLELIKDFDTIWHIDDGKIKIFMGDYDDYMRELKSARASIERELLMVKKEKRASHESLMKEQERAAKSKTKGHKSILERKWPTIVSNTKAGHAEKTSGRKKSAIEQKKQQLLERLDNLRLPEIIEPKFSIDMDGQEGFILISNGTVGYGSKLVLTDINLSLSPKSRTALIGKNASGKSTLVKALMKDESVKVSGQWSMPKTIGYLDQHYQNLKPEKSAFEIIKELKPLWSMAEVRSHLNDFLFRKNEEVNTKCKDLSGGEKARLSLAQIAAFNPPVLILDEVTNNLDLETKQHVIEVLMKYPGTLLVISHDDDFLRKINVSYLMIENGQLHWPF